MNQTAPRGNSVSYSAHVFPATDLVVVSGANIGDPLLSLEEQCLGDGYRLALDAEVLQLAISDASTTDDGQCLQTPAKGQFVADGSEVGTTGDALFLHGRLTFMAPDGDKVEILLIAHHATQAGQMLYFAPLSPIEPAVEYTLLSHTDDPGEIRVADLTPVAFTRGTMITLADGVQRAIEDLTIGDRILTRDGGAQPLRWIGQRTVRAIGPYAPVVIKRGTLFNESDMIVSQHQRLFIYNRNQQLLTGSAELLVKARNLVDGEKVFIRKGGYVQYFHLAFDQHEIIYAECTPTESLLINETTLASLPDDLAKDASSRMSDTTAERDFRAEAEKSQFSKVGPNALRRAVRRD
ncbi:Hint domain-containing protein [Actibacterium lipolyticum]|uniref:Hedgehog/Intein (Hint) domain-containing protein n=1 Tax=Actibacterium lipolyticum TaxID=1524263 RepID=A0A238JWT2_9RHOB|nr:Hint domain-containing protein [Actibacterium lipolyticum]SMX34166.1 hypothetical protein COL8621_01200 [Actibacterium lipolyticum]